MKRLGLIVLIVMLCGVSLMAKGGQEADGGQTRIAYVTPGLDVPFWRDLAGGIHAEADKMGVKIIDSDSRNSASTQLKNVQDLITAGVDAIIISPTDSASCPPVLELAAQAKVPVVICDIGTDSGDYVSFVISDNYGGAKAAGEYIAQQLEANGWKGGDVAMINISLTRQNGKDRLAGMKDAVEKAGSKVVAVLEAKNYTRAEAMKYAQDLLVAHPNLRGIFTAYDEGTLGAMVAIENVGRTNDMVLAGFDGSPESIGAMKDGKVGAMAIQQGVLMGREALRAAVDYLNGKTPAKKVSVPTFLVTKETVEDSMDTLIENVFPAMEK